MSSVHIPVLRNEVLDFLNPKADENFVDCTIGEGGHAFAVLERILPDGKLLGIDWTKELIDELRVRAGSLNKNLILVCDNFANLKNVVERHGFERVSGVLFDLGLSSWHLEKSGRGFSFSRDEPLNMRFQEGEVTAQDIVNEYPQKDLERILKEYGEERFAKKIAEEIVASREKEPITSTLQLVSLVERAVPKWYQRRRIHPATKTFQALRIAVNDELNNLEKALPQALEILKTGGRLVAISFHSLEDRIVKNFLKENSRKGLLEILTKKPVRPSVEEVKINPRSRSARLRAAIKI
ncbi:MAG: 16S rRNA (cytosine(1402)-N(4))-methyltransferase RsmH [Candidatus Bathycorpusculaceae bacterium]